MAHIQFTIYNKLKSSILNNTDIEYFSPYNSEDTNNNNNDAFVESACYYEGRITDSLRHSGNSSEVQLEQTINFVLTIVLKHTGLNEEKQFKIWDLADQIKSNILILSKEEGLRNVVITNEDQDISHGQRIIYTMGFSTTAYECFEKDLESCSINEINTQTT